MCKAHCAGLLRVWGMLTVPLSWPNLLHPSRCITLGQQGNAPAAVWSNVQACRWCGAWPCLLPCPKPGWSMWHLESPSLRPAQRGGGVTAAWCKRSTAVRCAGLQMVWGTGLSLTVSEGWLDFERPESDLRGSRGMTVVGSMMMFMSFCNCRNMVTPHPVLAAWRAGL